jgi:hypothetical protein
MRNMIELSLAGVHAGAFLKDALPAKAEKSGPVFHLRPVLHS